MKKIIPFLFLLILTKTLISQVKSEMQIGSKFKGGTIFKLFSDGSGGKLLFYVASGTFNDAYRKLEVEFKNGIDLSMADDYELQDLFQQGLIGPDVGNGDWNHLWFMSGRRMKSYSRPYACAAKTIVSLPTGYSERISDLVRYAWDMDRYKDECYYAAVGIFKLASVSEKPINISSVNAKPINNSSVIGEPIKINNLFVAQFDFPEAMSWSNALAACAKLGKGWRLPTKNELNTLYLNKEKIGGFWGIYYCSSTKSSDGHGWVQTFDNGYQYFGSNEKSRFNVRAVRDNTTLPSKTSSSPAGTKKPVAPTKK